MRVYHLRQSFSILALAACLISGQSLAAAETINSDRTLSPFFDESEAAAKSEMGYFTVSEKPLKKTSVAQFSDPAQLLRAIEDQVGAWIEKTGTLMLLKFDFQNKRYADYDEPYNRSRHFGTWLRDQTEDSCLNTRGWVLIRDSKVPVKKNPAGCTVVKGKWDDPYSGRVFTEAQDIQIDHVVALKNAYISGAHEWSNQKRCLYHNYMGNDFHLLSVFGRENASKSDKTPERYMPSNPSYQCQFLAEWLKIKLIWSLGLTRSEKLAIEQLAQQNRCDVKELVYTTQQLNEQRRLMSKHQSICQNH